ncbi:MAG: ribonuclease H family protein [Candidatus Cyclobacteriaceae bacterium M2_1C_046]
MLQNIIKIYTDGSCHTQLKIGAWAAILLIDDKKMTLEGIATDTTHNRMELLVVIKAFEYLHQEQINFDRAEVYSDSQYVVNIIDRKNKLKSSNFITQKKSPIQNADLVQELITIIESYPVEFKKVTAHQKQTDIINYNREVDKLARKMVRKAVDKKVED